MYKSKNHSKYSLKVHLVSMIKYRKKLKTTFELWKVHVSYLKKYFWKEHTFWSDGYFACSIGEGASYNTIKNTLKIKDRSQPDAQLKTDHFSGLENYKNNVQY